MSNIYLTADLHFHHPRCATQFRGFESTEEHDEHIINNWNAIVNKRDVVYVLGDVAMRRSGIQLVNRLSGIKRLILGNHDIHSKDLFEAFKGKVYGSCTMKEKCILLTHIPIELSQLVFRHGCNIHGHVHDKKYLPSDKRYISVNTEHHDYKPVALEVVYA